MESQSSKPEIIRRCWTLSEAHAALQALALRLSLRLFPTSREQSRRSQKGRD